MADKTPGFRGADVLVEKGGKQTKEGSNTGCYIMRSAREKTLKKEEAIGGSRKELQFKKKNCQRWINEGTSEQRLETGLCGY